MSEKVRERGLCDVIGDEVGEVGGGGEEESEGGVGEDEGGFVGGEGE